MSSRRIDIVNVDATIIAEYPPLSDHFLAMRETIANALGMDDDRVNVKATTNEGLGVIGSGQAIAAIAVALIEEHVR